MVSCRICGKNVDTENAGDHMKEHNKRGEIPHIQNESESNHQIDGSQPCIPSTKNTSEFNNVLFILQSKRFLQRGLRSRTLNLTNDVTFRIYSLPIHLSYSPIFLFIDLRNTEMNPTIPWLGELHTPKYLSSSFCSFAVHFYVHHYKQLECMRKQASTNTNQLWTKIRAKLGTLTINPKHLKTQSVIFYRIEYHLKQNIQSDVLQISAYVTRYGLYVNVTKEKEKEPVITIFTASYKNHMAL